MKGLQSNISRQSEMPGLPNVQIIIARETKKDDVIFIRPHAEMQGVFTVKYTDNDSGHVYYFEDSWEEVTAYLAQIFAVLPLDRRPYEGVQFNLPAYPTIWIKTKETTCPCVMEPIWDILNTLARGWPVLVKNPNDE